MGRFRITVPEEHYDDHGLNLADPQDSLGYKSAYITLLQQMALTRIVGHGSGVAVDIGCGTGRMTRFFASLGYTVIGLDPSVRLLRMGARENSDSVWCVGALPKLPLRDISVDNVFLINVLRPLYLLSRLESSADAARVVASGGRLVVLDNIAPGNSDYVEHEWIVQHFARAGLYLESATPIRFGRRLMTYCIRYGIVPRGLFRRIAAREIVQAGRITPSQIRGSYMNVVYVFRRPVSP